MNALTTTDEARDIAARMRALDSAAQAEAARKHSVRRVSQRNLDGRGLPRARRLSDTDAR